MIDVLLATYHPNPDWIAAQVESIRAQRDVDVRLIMREDVNGAGPLANFGWMLKASDGDYAAFADQDDVWDSGKLAKMMECMAKMEAEHGQDMPILVFCDSRVVDEKLLPRPGTLITRSGIDVKKGMRLERLLMQNFISGHAMLFNAALRDKAGEMPSDAIMHDYWIALVAAAFGRIGFADEPLVLYRQHRGNVVGAGVRSGSVAEFRRKLHRNVLQARAFLDRYGDECPECVRVLAQIEEMSWWKRRLAILRCGLFKHGLKRNMGLMLFA